MSIKKAKENFFLYNVKGYFDTAEWSKIIITIDTSNQVSGTLTEDQISLYNDTIPIICLLSPENIFCIIIGYTIDNNNNITRVVYNYFSPNDSSTSSTNKSIVIDIIDTTWSISETTINKVVANVDEESSITLSSIKIGDTNYYIKNYDSDIENIRTEITNEIERATQVEQSLLLALTEEVDERKNAIDEIYNKFIQYNDEVID